MVLSAVKTSLINTPLPWPHSLSNSPGLPRLYNRQSADRTGPDATHACTQETGRKTHTSETREGGAHKWRGTCRACHQRVPVLTMLRGAIKDEVPHAVRALVHAAHRTGDHCNAHSRVVSCQPRAVPGQQDQVRVCFGSRGGHPPCGLLRVSRSECLADAPVDVGDGRALAVGMLLAPQRALVDTARLELLGLPAAHLLRVEDERRVELRARPQQLLHAAALAILVARVVVVLPDAVAPGRFVPRARREEADELALLGREDLRREVVVDLHVAVVDDALERGLEGRAALDPERQVLTVVRLLPHQHAHHELWPVEHVLVALHEPLERVSLSGPTSLARDGPYLVCLVCDSRPGGLQLAGLGGLQVVQLGGQRAPLLLRPFQELEGGLQLLLGVERARQRRISASLALHQRRIR
eukprot:1178985-Prymnesium_polylepis.2